MRTNGLGLAGLLLAFGALSGCDEPLSAVELIQGVRVLGARIEVDGEPGRQAPLPGEKARASLLVASPQLNSALGFALQVCSSNGASGAPECLGEPFSVSEQPPGVMRQPSLEFVVPNSVDTMRRLLLSGIVCPGAAPLAGGKGCENELQGTRVTLEFELARPLDVNLNPTLTAESLMLDGTAWPASTPLDGDCAGLGFPEVSASSKHQLALTLFEQDRDALPETEGGGKETLQISHFVTDGTLERAFDVLAPEDTRLVRTVDWTAPSPEANRLVRFWYVVRDLRGGSDFTERNVCVLR